MASCVPLYLLRRLSHLIPISVHRLVESMETLKVFTFYRVSGVFIDGSRDLQRLKEFLEINDILWHYFGNQSPTTF